MRIEPPSQLGGFGALGVRGDLDDPDSTCASCSRKFDHSSARDSFRLVRSVNNSVEVDGVLGVRWNGDKGARRVLLPEVPGRASPACSRCSWESHVQLCRSISTLRKLLTFSPAEQRCNQLQHLKLFGIRSI